MEWRTRRVSLVKIVVCLLGVSVGLLAAAHGTSGPETTSPAVFFQDPCDRPANPIVAENCKPGNPPTEWDIDTSGDPSIQGFATDISVNRGETVSFKVDTDSPDYRIDIYRMG